ncbi:MAG: hypothetical protein U5L04_02660 [Trueperaceae bacterium]|nr:hypothetical protein [Trueperaceae bacterium]
MGECIDFDGTDDTTWTTAPVVCAECNWLYHAVFETGSASLQVCANCGASRPLVVVEITNKDTLCIYDHIGLEPREQPLE